ncbi:serine/threonine-protein phosphatase 4 regulatory subunit 2-A-like isoform X2 [Parambassis ranga]|uniref:Serine/threonine-protein phosphatase 4 regulatory subunit 2-A-like isoform X2 n=1 Tax=Parambassis ranga TaxID=210632 RepID=A0A6P7IVC1_9TELE|nr:serine/threonine-protein phosphatase 4 regulatory subunit 2-A-like isoform X2 [Parambassis ranga]
MDIDALLEAFQDFEKKGKKETCPLPEQFLSHIAKTGQPMISWLHFKPYFIFKLEKVMDDFHASIPEQRGSHNPNVEYVPFEEMKKRILKIVDGYNGIPFTIQRLCELLTDPKRNYTGTDKFLRGLEKNVMVVSCVYPASDRNVNGPGTPKPLTRPKLSLSTSLSTNGLPDCPVSKEPEPTTEEMEEHHIGESLLSGDVTPSGGVKNKHPDEADEEEDSEADKQEVKRLKYDEKQETPSEEMESSCHKEPESSSETKQKELSKDSCGQQYTSGTSCNVPSIPDNHEPSSTKTEISEEEADSSKAAATHSLKNDSTVDQSEEPIPSDKSTSFEQDTGENSSSSSSSDGEGLTSDKQVLSSGNSPELSTEGGADVSDSAESALGPEEHD